MKTPVPTPARDIAPGGAKSGSPTALFRKWFERSKGPVATRISAVFADLAHYAENGSSGIFKTMYQPPFEKRSLAFTTECLQRREFEVNLTRLLKAAEIPGHIFLARQIMVLLDGAISQSLRNRDGSYAIAAGAAATALLSTAQSARTQTLMPVTGPSASATRAGAADPVLRHG